ncbi:MAG TPA: helix-turn-helix domain-containing protein [Solirubrobacteraceae bacterium]|nr:helix-turn-helix domain-containing protein [Solirubrobacteraceae bacterium]
MHTAGHAGPERCLLDLDTDLADELELDIRRSARAAALAIVLDLPPGPIPIADWLALTTDGLGILVVDGVVDAEVAVGGRTASELLGAGDLIQPAGCVHDELLACGASWRALEPVRLAILDRRFVKRVRFWPQIHQALLRRAGGHAHDLNVQRAIAMHPRLEVRLTLMLWHLAARWGKVEPGGIRLPLPLTHQLLGRLIGAERPSVSHALARLARAGAVTRHGDEWHLHNGAADGLERIERMPLIARSRHGPWAGSGSLATGPLATHVVRQQR